MARKIPETMENIRTIIKKDGKKYTIRNNRDRFFFPDEWGKFYDKLRRKQKITFMFLINTGARINEARNVMVKDIDIERRRIILRVTKIKASAGEQNPRPRIIPISTQFARQINKYIKENNLKADDCFNILSTPAANIGMKIALQKAGIEDWQMFSIHNIRKSLEIWLMALNVDGLKITAHIGHSMAVAAKNYISPDVFTWDEKKKIRMVIGDLYER